ncbi:MAG: hypothetical protein Q9165_001827 [Trypethelium subeluteriae]
MSGVEGIFGLISGGAGLVSLGIQLAESAVKLKRILSTAKNAPQTISRHVFGLETMALALQQLEQHRQHDTHNESLLTRCIMDCRESTFQIQKAVDKMDHYMKVHNNIWGRFYTVYKEPGVKELFDDLERAKSSLELAYTIYLTAEQRRRDQALSDTLALHSTLLSGLQTLVTAGKADISQQLTQLLPSSSVSQQTQLIVADSCTAMSSRSLRIESIEIEAGETSSSGDYLEQGGRPLPARQAKRKTRRKKIRIDLPRWLSNRVWEFAISESQSSWGATLYTYNLVPRDSPIFRCCRSGDIDAMKRLIRSGEASLLDTTKDSWGISMTLLESAAKFAQLEVCRYLLDEIDWPDQTAVLDRALGNFIESQFEQPPINEIYRLFLEAPGFDADLEDAEIRCAWLSHCYSAKCLDLILANSQPRFYSLSVDARFEAIAWVRPWSLLMGPFDFLRYLGLQQSDQRLASLRSSSGLSVLHYIAHFLWRLIGTSLQDNLQEWLNLGLNVLKHGADPSCIARDISRSVGTTPRDFRFLREEASLSTPLMNALAISDAAFSDHHHRPHSRTEILKLIRTWAEMIQQAGLDLLEYGHKESQIWKTLGLGIEDALEVDRANHLERLKTRVGQLIYGATPADWSLTICSPPKIRVSMLHPLPGAFPESRNLPTTIIWNPTEGERNEGPWEIAEERVIPSRYRDLRDVVESRKAYEEVVDGVQDDSGAIMIVPRTIKVGNLTEDRHADFIYLLCRGRSKK